MRHPVVERAERAAEWRDHLRSRCARGVSRKPRNRIVLIAQVVIATCEYYGLTPEHLTTKGKEGETVRARQIAMFLARQMTGRSYPEIGRQMGDFDHSTVLHAYRKVSGQLDTHPDVRTDVDSIAAAVLHGW